jgi:hypothetical protein
MPLSGALRALNKRSKDEHYGIGVWTTTVTLDGSNPTPVVTPFRNILGATANVKGNTAQAVGAAGVRRVETNWSANSATVNITAWGHVLADATEIASTNSTAVITLIVVGEY